MISLIISIVANLKAGITASFVLSLARYTFYLGCLIALRNNVVVVRWCALSSVVLGLFTVFYNLQVAESGIPVLVREVTEVSVFPVVAFYMVRGKEVIFLTVSCFVMYFITFYQSVVVPNLEGGAGQ